VGIDWEKATLHMLSWQQIELQKLRFVGQNLPFDSKNRMFHRFAI